MDGEFNTLWKRLRSTVRGWWLYVLPLPLAFDALVSLWTGSLGAMLSATLAYGGFLVGATVARIGFLKEAVYDEKPFSTPPPRYKAIGAGIMALATAFAAYASAGHDVVTAGAFGIAFSIGFFLLYGFDPRPGALALPADLASDAKEIEAALREALCQGGGHRARRAEDPLAGVPPQAGPDRHRLAQGARDHRGEPAQPAARQALHQRLPRRRAGR